MKYQGGKTRLSRWIAAHLRPALGPDADYVEPFLGSAAVAVQVAPYADRPAHLSDANLDLVLMWQAAVDGWEPPSELTEQRYAELRDAEPSALRGFAGTTCSFGGKWFEGYAQDARGDDFVGAGRRSVLRRAAVLRDARAQLTHADYRDAPVRAGSVVYADPPYAGTKRYRATGDFDTAEFWAQASEWVSHGARVYVSEFAAPDDWRCLAQMQRRSTMDAHNNTDRVTERLFVHESQW